MPLAPTPVELQKREREIDDRLEKEIQNDVIKLYKAFSCLVYELSQKRAAKQTPGIADLWVFRRGIDHDRSFGFWHEVKTPSGVQSEAQIEFQAHCITCGVPYVLGGIEAARQHLIKFGIAEFINGTLEPFRDRD